MCKYSQFVKLIPVGGYVIFTIQKKRAHAMMVRIEYCNRGFSGLNKNLIICTLAFRTYTSICCLMFIDVFALNIIDKGVAVQIRIFAYSNRKLDSCIAWNAHNTVFGSKLPDICALAVYFLHSTRLVPCDSIVDRHWLPATDCCQRYVPCC